MSSQGKVFFINHNDKTTHWTRPAPLAAEGSTPPAGGGGRNSLNFPYDKTRFATSDGTKPIALGGDDSPIEHRTGSLRGKAAMRAGAGIADAGAVAAAAAAAGAVVGENSVDSGDDQYALAPASLAAGDDGIENGVGDLRAPSATVASAAASSVTIPGDGGNDHNKNVPLSSSVTAATAETTTPDGGAVRDNTSSLKITRDVPGHEQASIAEHTLTTSPAGAGSVLSSGMFGSTVKTKGGGGAGGSGSGSGHGSSSSNHENGVSAPNFKSTSGGAMDIASIVASAGKLSASETKPNVASLPEGVPSRIVSNLLCRMLRNFYRI